MDSCGGDAPEDHLLVGKSESIVCGAQDLIVGWRGDIQEYETVGVEGGGHRNTEEAGFALRDGVGDRGDLSNLPVCADPEDSARVAFGDEC